MIELAACSILLFAPSGMQAQQPPPPTCDATPFLDVGAWTGTVTIIGTGLGSYNDAFGRSFSYEIHQSISLAPTFAPGQLSPQQWSGPENAMVSVNDTYTEVTNDPETGTITTTTKYSGNGTSAMGGLGTGAAFQINEVPLSCGYAFGADSTFSPGTLTSTTVDRFGTTTSSSTGKIPWGAPSIPILLQPPASVQQVLPFPASGTTLSGSNEFDFFPTDVPSDFDPSQVIVHWVITWRFTPTTEPLDLIVTIPNYLSWRPAAGRDENSTVVNFQPPNFPPNLLQITAQVVFKDTQQPAPFGPEKISFSLVDVSHEPGVAMNWPPQNQLKTPVPPDMSFKAFDGKLGGFNDQFSFPNADGTQADFSPPDPSSANSATTIYLISYDWGGRATLNVTATAAGQSLQGHLSLPPNETDILLPNRQPGAWVADSWKAARGVTALSDNDDSETIPKGDGQSGDGLTQWEEYRGFYMGCSGNNQPPKAEGTKGCQHVEGDPKTKDLFVVDLLSVDAGIFLFEASSGLKVHFGGLSLAEVGTKGSASYRVINFNHSAGPHEVDQHALVIESFRAGDSIASGAGRPGLPREVDHIDITKGYQNIDPNTELVAGTVAHELAHAVDVYHHGDVDAKKWWSRDASGNITEQNMGPSGVPFPFPVSIIYVKGAEDDDPSILTTTESDFLLGLNFHLCTQVQIGGQCVLATDANGNPLVGSEVFVANSRCGNTVVTGGQHSGDQLDFMRYFNADAYIPKGFPQIRYHIGGGPIGSDLTDHPIGTGVNDPKRSPRSRYGDAYAGKGGDNDSRGNDKSQVDVNDNNQAIVRSLQTACPQ